MSLLSDVYTSAADTGRMQIPPLAFLLIDPELMCQRLEEVERTQLWAADGGAHVRAA